MLSEPVILALIGLVVPTVTVLMTSSRSNKKIDEVHQVVNSRLDTALNSIEALKTEIIRLNKNEDAGITPETKGTPSEVTLADGIVSVKPKDENA